MKTRQWSSFDKANNPTPPYSKEEIDQIIADEHDRSWVDIVKIRNLPVFYYEDLCDNINNVMDKLETLMRERFPLRSQNTLKKQESPEKESYIRRYRKESRDLIHH